jgi:glycosyltransferase involved in cell wall biosynthesis
LVTKAIVGAPIKSFRVPYGALRRAARSLFKFDILAYQLSQYRPDVVHYPFGVALPALLTPSVLTIHDIQHEFYPEFFSPEDLYFRKRAFPESARNADYLIAISEFTRQTVIQKYSIDPAKIITIHYGLDEQFTPLNGKGCLEEIKAKYKLPSRFIFYPANSWPHKNHAGLFEAMKKLKARHKLSFKLVLAGVIYPQHKDIMDRVRFLGLEDDVVHIGYISHIDTPFIYRQALCLVFPSFFEGFGAPVLEAMGCACPVVCSNVTSLPEIVGDAALKVTPENVDSIAEAIERVVEDNSLREKLVEKGLERTRAFSWANAARETRAVYYKALGSPID